MNFGKALNNVLLRICKLKTLKKTYLSISQLQLTLQSLSFKMQFVEAVEYNIFPFTIQNDICGHKLSALSYSHFVAGIKHK